MTQTWSLLVFNSVIYMPGNLTSSVVRGFEQLHIV